MNTSPALKSIKMRQKLHLEYFLKARLRRAQGVTTRRLSKKLVRTQNLARNDPKIHFWMDENIDLCTISLIFLWGPRCQARLLNSRLAQGDQRKYRNFAWAAHRASISILTRKWPFRVSNRQKFSPRGPKAGSSAPCTPEIPDPVSNVRTRRGRPPVAPPVDIQYNKFCANDHIYFTGQLLKHV